MAFSAAFKVYSRFSSRRFMSDMRDAKRRGFVAQAPSFNAVSSFLSDPALTPMFKHLITLSSLPLKAIEQDFAIDSTGFSTSRFVRWFNKKYGYETDNREWVKLHAMCGVTTNVVTSCEVTGWTAADTNYFKPLLEATAENFQLKSVSADKAYLSHDNANAVEKLGAQPFIPFKLNTVPPKTQDGAWERMYHLFAYQREAFLTGYHKRSNVETTFSMIKAKFGDSVLSKSDTGQMNEALCKVLAHNICCVISAIHELGIQPQFRQVALPVAG
jgi:transposase